VTPFPDRRAVRVRITGRVQGVWFRAWTREQATARGLDGWVRNRADGTVEALFAGPGEAVDDMLAACRKGPPAAKVTGVTTEPAQDVVAKGFRLMPTV
jgi:acylphosphatase